MVDDAGEKLEDIPAGVTAVGSGTARGPAPVSSSQVNRLRTTGQRIMYRPRRPAPARSSTRTAPWAEKPLWRQDRRLSTIASVTSVEEWLELSPQEVAISDMKIQLGEELKALRCRKKLTQEEAAELLHTSQGRVSKMERGQASLEQLTWSLLVMGESRKRLARVISG